jgi:hypothetical protein
MRERPSRLMAWLTPKETTAREEQAHSGEQKES